jgi:hypothetical protein
MYIKMICYFFFFLFSSFVAAHKSHSRKPKGQNKGVPHLRQCDSGRYPTKGNLVQTLKKTKLKSKS